jgi:hypothetical protein
MPLPAYLVFILQQEILLFLVLVYQAILKKILEIAPLATIIVLLVLHQLQFVILVLLAIIEEL